MYKLLYIFHLWTLLVTLINVTVRTEGKKDDNSFKERCRSLDKQSTNIDAVVKFPDALGGQLYAFSGDLVSKVNFVDSSGNVQIETGFPIKVDQQWPGLEANLDAVFVLNEQVVFVKVSCIYE